MAAAIFRKSTGQSPRIHISEDLRMPQDIQEKPELSGIFELTVTDKDGNVVEHIEEHNMIVGGARQAMAKFIGHALTGGQAAADDLYVSKLFVGTGTVASAAENTVDNTFRNNGEAVEGEDYYWRYLTPVTGDVQDGSAVFGTLLTGQDGISGTSVRFNWELTASECTGMAITEFGLVCNDADETLFARRLRSPINKAEDLTFNGSWTIIF